MGTTLTIRLERRLREAVDARAGQLGKTASELVREILEEALEDKTLLSRTGHVKGRLRLASPRQDAWQSAIRKRNWRA